MYSLLFLGITSFLLTLLQTPLIRDQAHRLGLVDRPDSRKIHTIPIPRLGGIAIVLSYVGAFCALLITPFNAVRLIEGGLPLALRIAPAVATMFAIGIWDDLHSIRPWQKFAGQILAASFAYAAGVQINDLGGHPLPDFLKLLATIFWLVLCANAVNLMDGVDGLATGIGLFATATTLLVALRQHNTDLALVVTPLLGCLLGFIPYNLNPATIFLGDSGSLFIGFILGCCSIIWSQKSATILGMTAPLLALSIPLLDTLLTVVLRFLGGQSIFTADRGHIHPRLLARGFTMRRVTLLLYAAAGFGGVLALLMSQYSQWGGAIIVLFAVGTIAGIQQLRYAEFGAAGRLLLAGTFRRLLSTQISLNAWEKRLVAARTLEECWSLIESFAREFGFNQVEMSLAGHRFFFQDGVSPIDSWQVRVPFSDSDFLQMNHPFAGSHEANLIGQFIDTLRRTLLSKFPIYPRSPAACRPTEMATAASSNGG